MSNETLFYICGIALAVSAVTVSLLGLKLKSFPGRALPIVVLWFALLVGGATTFAVLHAQDEEKAKAAELEQAGREVENAQTGGPFEGEEEGAEGGESEGAAGSPGAQVFADSGCGTCHTLAAAGSTGKTGPNLDEFLAPDDTTPDVEEMIVKPNTEVAEGYSGNVMPANYGERLSETEVEQLALYLVATTPAKPAAAPKGKGGTAAKGAGGTLELAANPTQIAYEQTQLTSKPGKVTIDFTNPAALEHDVAIEGPEGKRLAVSETIAKGKTSVSAELAPGTYHYFCTVPGHREAGMEGTLTVK
jgi:plastocyanin